MWMKGGDARSGNGIPSFGRVAADGLVENHLLAVFCSGLLGPETGRRPAYGFVVASCIGSPKRSSKTLGVGPFARSGGNPYGGPTGGFEGGIVHSHAALLVDGPGGGLLRGLGEEALLAVSEYRAALAALTWLEAQGRSGERILLFTGSRPLAKRYEEPFGLWRATRRTGEGAALKEVLATLSRFGDLSVKWWRPADPEGMGETGGLAWQAAKEISARARVVVLEEGRRERAKDVKLERIGRGLYRANDRYLVDAIFGLCGCRDFERHNGKKRRKKGEAGVPFVVVRCKHLIAAEEAEGRSDRREQDTAPSRSASTSPLIPGARSKARGGNAGGGHKP